MIGRFVRRTTAGFFGVMACATGLWTTLLVISGGIDLTIAGHRVTSPDPMRPLIGFALTLAVYMLIGGDGRITRWARMLAGGSPAPAWRTRLDAWSRAGHVDRVVLAGLALFVLTTGLR